MSCAPGCEENDIYLLLSCAENVVVKKIFWRKFLPFTFCCFPNVYTDSNGRLFLRSRKSNGKKKVGTYNRRCDTSMKCPFTY